MYLKCNGGIFLNKLWASFPKLRIRIRINGLSWIVTGNKLAREMANVRYISGTVAI
jgi:hypothetical protein